MEKVDLRNAKLLGGIGAVIPFISALFLRRGTFLSLILSIASIVLILVALNEISNKMRKGEIFSYYLTGFIVQVIGYIVLIIFAIFGGLSLLLGLGFGSFGALRTLGFGSILLLLAFYVLLIVSYYYIKLSFDTLSETLNVPHFKTAGLLLFIGAILLIIVVGALVMLVGEIFEIIAFFSIPDEVEINSGM